MTERVMGINCDDCVIEGGCSADVVLDRIHWLLTTQVRQPVVRSVVMERMLDAGVEITTDRICIKGLSEQYPTASDAWLVDRANTLHHIIGPQTSIEINGPRNI